MKLNFSCVSVTSAYAAVKHISRTTFLKRKFTDIYDHNVTNTTMNWTKALCLSSPLANTPLNVHEATVARMSHKFIIVQYWGTHETISRCCFTYNRLTDGAAFNRLIREVERCKSSKQNRLFLL